MKPDMNKTAARTLLLLLFAASAAFGQGFLIGTAIDADNGAPIPGVPVTVDGPASFEVKTNTEGMFQLEVPAGTYSVTYKSANHPEAVVSDIVVEDGGAVDASGVLGTVVTEVVVEESIADVGVATQEAMLVERKLATTVSDSISAEEIKSGTAADAAGALEKVTGVSVVEDKFVYVRGLGERYSATTLNNSMLATTEPERRVVPLDLFPANLIDNIKVLKSYSADLPGEFSAGLVQIETTEFPTGPTLSVSYSVGFNSRTQGNPFLDYPGGGNDFWGFDDGTRGLPGAVPTNTRVDRFNFDRDELQSIGQSFAPNWQRGSNTINRPTQTFNIVAGNSFGKDNQFGLVGALTFSNGVRSNFAQTRNIFQPDAAVANGTADPNSVPPTLRHSFIYDESVNNVRLGAVGNFSWQISSANKIVVRNFLSRDTDNETRFLEGFQADFQTNVRDTRLRWVERTIYSGQVEGEHLITSAGNSLLNWQLSYSRSTRDEPDLRQSLYGQSRRTGEFEFLDDANSAFRMFNDLKEDIFNPQISWQTPFYKGNWTGSFKVGANFSIRERDFNSRRFRLRQAGNRDIDLTEAPNLLFAADNIRPDGFEFVETTRITDAYLGERDVFGYFGMADFSYKRFRFIGGLRVETLDQNVTSFNQFNPSLNRQEAPFDRTNYLPSANFIYELSPRQNLRVGFSQTVSRPDFRELALFDFIDVVGGRLTVGNPDLLQTRIRNYDVRWEMFPGGNQLLAASFFYKSFADPIERVVFQTVGLVTTYANATSAENFGFELEARRSLDFLGPGGRQFAASGNFTWVDSDIDLSDIDPRFVLTNSSRPLQGQSRYVGNSILEWNRPDLRSTARFYVNYFSDRITDVGSLGLPDVIQNGVTTIDVVYELALQKEGKWKLRFAANNLNNPKWLWTQGGETFTRYTLGQSYSIGTTYQIF